MARSEMNLSKARFIEIAVALSLTAAAAAYAAIAHATGDAESIRNEVRSSDSRPFGKSNGTKIVVPTRLD